MERSMTARASWLFAQNSTSLSACQHAQITLANDEVPALCCPSCGKRWSFVPAGATPRYCADDDPMYPGMLDNRGWSKTVRAAITDDHGHGAAIARDVRLGRTSQEICDEIIAKVGMMADARTPEMQARYDAAVARERGSKPSTRHWRNSGVAWFWSGDREDFGSVILEAGRYVATTVRGTAAFDSLVDAKGFVEEHSS